MKKIALDNAMFNKTAQRLNRILNQSGAENTSLSTIQESLAQSLGFRNTHALQTFFNKESTDLLKKDNYFLNDVSLEQAYCLFKVCLPADDMWAMRAISLAHIVLQISYTMRNVEEVNHISFSLLKENMLLDNIIGFYRKSADKNSIYHGLRQDLQTYLEYLPGFESDLEKQYKTTYEQHSYLQLQIMEVIKRLEPVEKHDYLLLSPAWLENKEESNNKKMVNPYQDKIQDNEYFENSWLTDVFFERYIKTRLKHKKSFSPFYMSDLLYLLAHVINEKRKKELITCIKNLLDNYPRIPNYTESFNKSIKII